MPPDARLLAVFVLSAVGLAVGSFLALASVRLPAGESFLGGRSRCRGCGRTLGARDLVPVLSWVAARGRCRGCDARIGWRYPAIEVAAGVIGGAAAFVAPDVGHALAGALLGWGLLLLAVLDVEHLWLPEPLTLGLVAAGLGATAWLTPGMFVDHLIGAAVGFGSLWLVGEAYRRVRGREGLGGGDARLLAAAGAWLGWAALPGVLLGAAGLGLVGAGVLAARGRLEAGARLPFGGALAVAIGVAWLVTR